MKEHINLINILNSLLMEELNTIKLRMANSEIFDNWAYAKLYLVIQGQVLDEKQHAEWLFERRNFFKKTVSWINPDMNGKSVSELISNDYKFEPYAFNSYKSAIKRANEEHDRVHLALLNKIDKIEEEHQEWNQILDSQIDQTGLENYMTYQPL